MAKLFEENGFTVSPNVLPSAGYTPFRDMGWNRDAIRSDEAVKKAEKILGDDIPALPATLYMQFYRIGNRANYERPYFIRRDNVFTLAIAELTERKGRFTDKLVDYIWAICEETTWVIPAHNTACHGNPKNCLCDAFNQTPEDDVRYIDLFSAETGAVLTWIWYLLAEELDEVTPVIRRRIRDMLRNRILHPYYNYDDTMWWIGSKGQTLNNWTPWIISNVLVTVMFCEDDDEKRTYAVRRAMTILDRFIGFYKTDGGCDEGPGYWSVAGASYFDCLEILWDLTDGSVDLFGNTLVRRMGEYIADFNLTGRTFVNFADASHILTPAIAMIARYGRRCGSDKLTAYAAEKAKTQSFDSFSPRNCTYRTIKNLLETVPAMPENLPSAENIFYDGLEVFIAKNAGTGMSLAAKGGNNHESHNHNDVGSFILFRGEKPVFLDPGVETYSKKTFSGERYTLWAMRSLYHNLPAVNGTEQRAGNFHADEVTCDGTSLCMELKNAYPESAGIVSFRRTAKLTETGAEITDRIVLREEGSVVFTLMAAEEAEVSGNGFTLPDAACRADYDESLTLAAESVPLTDPKLHGEWKKDALTRILLSSAPFTEKVFTLTVTAL